MRNKKAPSTTKNIAASMLVLLMFVCFLWAGVYLQKWALGMHDLEDRMFRVEQKIMETQ